MEIICTVYNNNKTIDKHHIHAPLPRICFSIPFSLSLQWRKLINSRRDESKIYWVVLRIFAKLERQQSRIEGQREGGKTRRREKDHVTLMHETIDIEKAFEQIFPYHHKHCFFSFYPRNKTSNTSKASIPTPSNQFYLDKYITISIELCIVAPEI